MAEKVTLVRSRAIDPAIYKIADTVFKNGYDVKLLIWDRDGCSTPKANYRIDRFLQKAPYDNFTKVLLHLPFWMAYEFIYLLRDSPAIIQASDLDTLIPAIMVKFLKKAKVCYIIYDFTAENIPPGMPSFIKKFVAGAEKLAIGFTDALFLVDECRYPQIEGAKVRSLSYIYNSPPDGSSLNKISASDNDGKITIFYAGIIHKSRGIEYMIKALESFEDVHLVIAGTGPSADLFASLPASLKNKIEYVGHLPYDKVIESSMKADILFAFYDPAIPNNKYASPNKLFEAMMCGKPIIINSGIAAGDIVREEECGVLVPYGDVDAIVKKIAELKDNKEYREMLGKNGRAAYEKKYSWRIMENRLLDEYHKLRPGLSGT